MKMQYIQPTILILIDIGASIPYFAQGDWKRGVYWLSAAMLTASITF